MIRIGILDRKDAQSRDRGERDKPSRDKMQLGQASKGTDKERGDLKGMTGATDNSDTTELNWSRVGTR